MRVGVWLVRDDAGWTMVDTGSPRDAQTVARAALALTGGVPPERIVLTHGHYDHAGSLRTLFDRWSVPILAHQVEAPFLEGKASYDATRPAWWGYQIFQRLGGKYNRTAPVSEVQPLREGDVVGGLEVRHVPGHTPGMIALVHRADRAVLAGDTFIARDGRLQAPIALFTPDRDEARRSMRKLAAEDFDHLLPSHGHPILAQGKAAAIQAADGVGN